MAMQLGTCRPLFTAFHAAESTKAERRELEVLSLRDLGPER